MKKIILVLLLLMLAQLTFTQTLKRWTNGRIEMKNKDMQFDAHPNIFNEFLWTYPDLKSTAVDFNNGSGSFSMGGKNYTATLEEGNKMSITVDGNKLSADSKRSDGKMYYDKSVLKLKPVTTQVNTPHTVMTTQYTTETRSRQVTSYSYQNGRSVPQYRTEYYTVSVSKPVTKTEWRYESRTIWVLDIPEYDYYSFAAGNGMNLIFYKVSDTQYYCQNSAYLMAKDESGINHIFIDANSDGNLLDEQDKVMFNTWDPFSPKSTFRSAGAFRENKWYDMRALKEYNFLSFSKDDEGKRLKIDYENSKYSGDKEKGKVLFTNLPPKAKLFVNGEEYSIRKQEEKFKSQYGKFSLRITADGYMDFEKTYVVDSLNPNLEISYESTSPAGKVTISNIFENNYFVTVTQGDNYSRTYNNGKEFSVPEGKNNIVLYTDGYTIEKELEVKAGEQVNINFEEETKALQKVENTEQPPVQEGEPVKEE